MKLKKLIEAAAGLYIDLSSDEDLDKNEIPIGKEVEDKQKQTLEILNEISKEIGKVKEFIKEGRKIVKENEDIFATSFAEPYFDDFLNVLLLDLNKKKVINEKEFKKLKKEYKGEDIDIYV
jgi:hypothetical protein